MREEQKEQQNRQSDDKFQLCDFYFVIADKKTARFILRFLDFSNRRQQTIQKKHSYQFIHKFNKINCNGVIFEYFPFEMLHMFY